MLRIVASSFLSWQKEANPLFNCLHAPLGPKTILVRRHCGSGQSGTMSDAKGNETDTTCHNFSVPLLKSWTPSCVKRLCLALRCWQRRGGCRRRAIASLASALVAVWFMSDGLRSALSGPGGTGSLASCPGSVAWPGLALTRRHSLGFASQHRLQQPVLFRRGKAARAALLEAGTPGGECFAAGFTALWHRISDASPVF